MIKDNQTIHVLQIANDYIDRNLYRVLFAHLEKKFIKNSIYVPISYKRKSLASFDGNICVDACFSNLDRLLFYSKQKKMLHGICAHFTISSFDIIHAHTLFSGGYAAYKLHKKYGIPYIVAVRNTDVNVFFKYMLHLRSTGIRIMREAEKVIFLSPAYQSHVLSKYVPAAYQDEIQRKSVIIPNGIAPLFFEHPAAPKSLSGNPVRLIYVGEISSNKNLETTVQAAGLLRKKGLDLSLTVVGAILEEKYRSIIQKTSFIEYHDRCPQEEVLTYLRAADIFVMPSHTETFGLVYAEAMSQGLPVLYTRGQGFDGQFPDGTAGYAVSDTDPQELADKIEQVMDRYSTLSENCVRLVGKFNWDSIAQQYKNIYQTIIEGE